MKFHIFPAATDSPSPSRAIMLFAGWGMDEKPFGRLALRGYRVIVLWDYRSPTPPPELLDELRNYEEIAVVAWSFGVPAATRFLLAHPEFPVSARIAVNGTMHPVDDSLGIPEAIFRGTLEGLTEKSLSKFYLRMAGSADAFMQFSATLPDRNIEELREELSAIESDGAAAGIIWDRTVVGRNDRIIPPANQFSAWSTEAFDIIETDWAHLPDFNTIFSAMLTEKGLVAEKFTRAETTYDDNAVAQREIAGKLCGMIPGEIPQGGILEIGCGTGLTTRLLAERAPGRPLTVWDLHIPASLRASLPAVTLECRECDAETGIRRVADSSLSLIFSASTVQWFNSLPEFLRQCSRVLRPGGMAVISTFGPDTMREIRTQLPDSIPYPSLLAISRMIPPGCDTVRLSEERLTITFPTPVEALRHAKLTGVNALSSRHSGNTARSVIASYPLTPDGNATVTYHPIYIVFRKS